MALIDTYETLAEKHGTGPELALIRDIRNVQRARTKNLQFMSMEDADRIGRVGIDKAELDYRERIVSQKKKLAADMGKVAEPYLKHLTRMSPTERANRMQAESTRIKAMGVKELIAEANYYEAMPADVLGGVDPADLNTLAAELRTRNESDHADTLRSHMKRYDIDSVNEAWKHTEGGKAIQKELDFLNSIEAGTIGIQGAAPLKISELAGEWASVEDTEREEARRKGQQAYRERKATERTVKRAIEKQAQKVSKKKKREPV